MLSPVFRSNKAIIRYCRLATATPRHGRQLSLLGLICLVQFQAVLAHKTLPPCKFLAEKSIFASQVQPFMVLIALQGACYVLPLPAVSVKPPDHCIGIVSFYALPGFMCLCASGGKPTLLLNIMDSQLEAVRQDIHDVKEKIVRIEQNLASAEQAGNKGAEEEVRFLRGRLEKLDSQLLSLNEKENILLRGQASGNHCLQLVHAGLLVFSSCCTPFAEQ